MAVRRWSFLMPAQDHGFIRWILARYRARLTPLGRAMLWATALGTLLSAPGTIIGAYYVPAVGIGALLAAWTIGLAFRPRVEARRELPPPPSAGQTLRYQVRLRNRGRHTVKALSVTEGTLPFGLHMVPEHDGGCATTSSLAPGAEVSLSLAVRCMERGAYELKPILAGSAFPSGLIRWPRRGGGGQRLVVYPRFVTQHEFELPVGRRYQPGGIAVSSNVGDSTEFLGTREYRDGDRLRDIHWSSYARSGRLIVKEYREEYFVRVGLVLDTELAAKARPASFERRVSLAAGIADALARRDHIIDLFAAGDKVYRFQTGRALARLDNVLELLACVEPARSVDFTLVESMLVQHADQLSSIVLLLWDWDEERARVCRRLREVGTGVRPIVVRDPPPTAPPEPSVVVVPATAGPELLR
jgi:uncharacterized repeat protein (TIGR01451 family)